LSKKRVVAIDGLRVIAILGVILIHTTTRVLEVTHYNLNFYAETLFLNQFARYAVPLFFLISGFVLELNYKEDLNFWAYIKKRFSKIFIPYIIWSLIYYYFIYTNNSNNLIYVFLTGNASYQLYFIPTLCIFYILFPFFHKLYKFISQPIILITLGALQVWLLYHDYFIKNFSFVDPVRISILSFFFFVSGMILSHYLESIINFCKKWKIIFAVLMLILAFYIYKEGMIRYFQTYNINAFYSSWRPSTLIYTFVTGAALLAFFEKINLKKLSDLSYFVFFIHVAVIEFVWKFAEKFMVSGFYFDISFFVLVAVISFIIAFSVHKIPYLSKFFG